MLHSLCDEKGSLTEVIVELSLAVLVTNYCQSVAELTLDTGIGIL